MFCDWETIDFFKSAFDKHFKLKNILIWAKNNWSMGDLRGAYAHQYEMILFGHKGRTLLTGKRYPDVLHFDRVANLNHPNEKPIDLLRFLIRNSSQEGDLVFDGFAGSGSTAVAAMDEERNYCVVEIDENYCRLIEERVKTKQLRLF